MPASSQCRQALDDGMREGLCLGVFQQIISLISRDNRLDRHSGNQKVINSLPRDAALSSTGSSTLCFERPTNARCTTGSTRSAGGENQLHVREQVSKHFEKKRLFLEFLRFVRVPPYESWANWTNFYFSCENSDILLGRKFCNLYHTKNEEKSQKISTHIRIPTYVYAKT